MPAAGSSSENAQAVIGGAALAGGAVVGIACGSVVLGVAGAGAAAYAATRQDAIGNAAKATGGAVVAGIGKAKELDQKHHLTAALKQGVEQARAFNQKHDITGKIAGGVEFGMNKLTAALAVKGTAEAAPGEQGSSLPQGWKALATPDGRLYYWNERTGATTWERPTV